MINKFIEKYNKEDLTETEIEKAYEKLYYLLSGSVSEFFLTNTIKNELSNKNIEYFDLEKEPLKIDGKEFKIKNIKDLYNVIKSNPNKFKNSDKKLKEIEKIIEGMVEDSNQIVHENFRHPNSFQNFNNFKSIIKHILNIPLTSQEERNFSYIRKFEIDNIKKKLPENLEEKWNEIKDNKIYKLSSKDILNNDNELLDIFYEYNSNRLFNGRKSSKQFNVNKSGIDSIIKEEGKYILVDNKISKQKTEKPTIFVEMYSNFNTNDEGWILNNLTDELMSVSNIEISEVKDLDEMYYKIRKNEINTIEEKTKMVKDFIKIFNNYKEDTVKEKKNSKLKIVKKKSKITLTRYKFNVIKKMVEQYKKEQDSIEELIYNNDNTYTEELKQKLLKKKIIVKEGGIVSTSQDRQKFITEEHYIEYLEDTKNIPEEDLSELKILLNSFKNRKNKKNFDDFKHLDKKLKEIENLPNKKVKKTLIYKNLELGEEYKIGYVLENDLIVMSSSLPDLIGEKCQTPLQGHRQNNYGSAFALNKERYMKYLMNQSKNNNNNINM